MLSDDYMKPICEVMVMDVLPGIRAMIARKLVEDHKFSQKVAAEKLGTTQPAISQYKRELRGHDVRILKKNMKLLEMVDSLSERIAKGELNPEQTTMEFCRICEYIRRSGIASEIQKRVHSSGST